MSKKDYELIAESLKNSQPDSRLVQPEYWSTACAQWKISVKIICDSLSNNNPRFNREKFLKACGYN